MKLSFERSSNDIFILTFLRRKTKHHKWQWSIREDNENKLVFWEVDCIEKCHATLKLPSAAFLSECTVYWIDGAFTTTWQIICLESADHKQSARLFVFFLDTIAMSKLEKKKAVIKSVLYKNMNNHLSDYPVEIACEGKSIFRRVHLSQQKMR